MKCKKMTVFGLMIILIFSLSNVDNIANGFSGQTLTFAYVAKAGDLRSFTLSNYFVNGTDSFNGTELDLMNLVSGPTNLTLKVGTNFTVTICNVTGSRIPQQTLYTKITYENKTTSCVNDEDPLFFGTHFVKYLADNKSYYSHTAEYDNKSQLNGNIFTQSEGGIENVLCESNCLLYNTSESFDITTGWLTESSYTWGYTNGTITAKIDIKSLNENTFSNTVNIPGFEFIPVLTGFLILVPVVKIKRKGKKIY